MEPTSIELNLISCKDINAFNFFQKLTLYTLVSIDTNDPKTQLTPQQKQQQRTQTHRDPEDGDGTNPVWNHKAKFDLAWVPRPTLLEGSRTDLFFRFEFRHDGVILGDKIVGECRVPLLDLIRDAGCADDVARFVSYEVRNGDGKANGIFNFSYRLKGVWSGTHSSQILEGKISGYPVVDSIHESLVQYPTVEIEEPCWCSPSAAAEPPPLISSPSYGEYNYYYPPPAPYPPPPPPPVSQYYPPFGPEAHPYPWPSGPSFEHRW